MAKSINRFLKRYKLSFHSLPYQPPTQAAKIRGYFKKRIFDERLGNWIGVTGAILAGLFFAVALWKTGFAMGVVLIGAIIGIPIFFGVIFNPFFGVIVIVSISYVLLGAKRLAPEVPLGLFTDVMVLVLAFSVIINNTEKKDWSFAKGAISIMVAAYMVFVFMTFINPSAPCKLCFIYTIRSMAGYMIMYFIVGYTLKTKDDIKVLVKLWVFLSFLAGLYALKQEWVGFSSSETAWIYADDERFRLLFQWGRVRKFSFMSDPVSFGFNMGYTSVLGVVLMFGKISKARKIQLLIMNLVMFQAMLYSGTRAAFVILPIGAMMFLALCKIKKFYYLSGFGALFFLFILFAPINNPTIKRFQSAFKPGEDASFQVRLENQRRIRPWIWRHPLGGGLGATGVWGERFAPESFLAKFPPDSGYVRVAVELGWVGLTLHMVLWIVIFIQGINNYFKLKDPFMKNVALAMLCTLFSLYIVNYAQQATNQLPTSLLFWIAAGVVSRAGQIEQEGEKMLKPGLNPKLY